MFKFARIIALIGAAVLLLAGGMAAPASAGTYDYQKTPAECPLTLSEPDLFACSETYYVQAAPGDGGRRVRLPADERRRGSGEH